jgi:hypothetical protein
MFSQTVDLTQLKQGDVIRAAVFPIARIDGTRFLSRLVGTAEGKVTVEAVSDGTPERPFHPIQVQGTCVPCAILSQCCDVSPHQKPPPHSFVVCKLVPVPKTIRKHQGSYETLIANLDPYGGRKAYIQNFWFGDVPGLKGEFMADFAQVTTVSWLDYQQTLAGKTAELDELHRAMFRVKAGAHFGRVAEEDAVAGYDDPYRHADAEAPPKTPYTEKLAQAIRLILGRS